MYTPHPLDRDAQGDSRPGAASAGAKPTAGPALYPAAIHHASSSMADNQPLVPVAYQSQMFQAFGAARQNIHSAAWNGSPLQDQSTAAAPAWQHLCSRVNRCLRKSSLSQQEQADVRCETPSWLSVWPSNGDPWSKAGCCVFTFNSILTTYKERTAVVKSLHPNICIAVHCSIPLHPQLPWYHESAHHWGLCDQLCKE